MTHGICTKSKIIMFNKLSNQLLLIEELLKIIKILEADNDQLLNEIKTLEPIAYNLDWNIILPIQK
jgi:hypothetical protein